ncbi:MAG: cytochrome P450 [Bacillota bacterium]|nr:cytochrome P450 [Bacillota bacterium]
MAGNRSVFVGPDYKIDSFDTLYSLPPEKVQDADTLQQLMKKTNKTASEITQMNNLMVELAPYYINPETWNHMGNCITNLETNWMNIYHSFTEYIDEAQADIDTYINNNKTVITNFINQKEVDITTFVNTREQEIVDFVTAKENEMTDIKDSYVALVKQKELELADLDSRTVRYWQGWNATTNGQFEYNIFDVNGFNKDLPEDAILNIDPNSIELTINGVIRAPYVDYRIKNDGNYKTIQLLGTSVNNIVAGTEILIFYYKNVGKLYFNHAVTHMEGGRDPITVSEGMLSDSIKYKINNNIVDNIQPTTPFQGQVWFKVV